MYICILSHSSDKSLSANPKFDLEFLDEALVTLGLKPRSFIPEFWGNKDELVSLLPSKSQGKRKLKLTAEL